MTRIVRNPTAVTNEKFDAVVVGGGIYGAMLLLQAAQQGLKVLLLERNDFGAGTSFNSLRIIHGGLRYLQSLDLARFYESVAERGWLLKTFPNLVKPMPCLMPLYNQGMKRPVVLKTAMLMNNWLSFNRNDGAPAGRDIENGRVLSIEETRQKFPGVISKGLTGSALWYDAHAPDTQRIIMDTLTWACGLGASAFNYTEVTDVLMTGKRVIGVQVKDSLNNSTYEYRCDTVINATGPFSREFSRKYDRDVPALFRPTRAWNLLFDQPAVSECALALTPDRPGAQTYFLHPWKGRLLAGTGHAPMTGSTACDDSLSDELLDVFVADMNRVMPGMTLTRDNIERILSGCLPATEEGGASLTKRAVIHNHGSNGGPQGLYSISGIKFTTARREAEKTLKLVLGRSKLQPLHRTVTHEELKVTTVDYDWMPVDGDDSWKTELQTLIAEESPMHLEDLIYRRTSLGDNANRVRVLAGDIASLFDWDEAQAHTEVAKVLDGL